MYVFTGSKSSQIAITTMQCFLVILNIAGNSLVCVIIMKNQDMRTSINFLLMNLAVADMTAATFFLPQFIFLSSSAHPDGESGKILCRLVTGGTIAYIGGVASVVTLVAIAAERYYAVVHPYENIGKLTDRKMKVIVTCSWIFGVIINSPTLMFGVYDEKEGDCIDVHPEEWMEKAYSVIWSLFTAVLPVSFMITLYSRVAYTLWFKRAVHDGREISLQQSVLRVRKRVTLMVITVSVIFGVCWLADAISWILTSFSSHYASSDMSYIATSTLILFNSAINPIVYALVNQKFRAKIKSTVSCPCSVTRKLQLTDVRVGCKAEAFEHSPYLAAVIRIPENKISNARALSAECIAI